MSAAQPYLQERIACGCIVEQDARKPSIYWHVAEPCSEHERGDAFVDDLRLALLNKVRTS